MSSKGSSVGEVLVLCTRVCEVAYSQTSEWTQCRQFPMLGSTRRIAHLCALPHWRRIRSMRGADVPQVALPEHGPSHHDALLASSRTGSGAQEPVMRLNTAAYTIMIQDTLKNREIISFRSCCSQLYCTKACGLSRGTQRHHTPV